MLRLGKEGRYGFEISRKHQRLDADNCNTLISTIIQHVQIILLYTLIVVTIVIIIIVVVVIIIITIIYIIMIFIIIIFVIIIVLIILFTYFI